MGERLNSSEKNLKDLTEQELIPGDMDFSDEQILAEEERITAEIKKLEDRQYRLDNEIISRNDFAKKMGRKQPFAKRKYDQRKEE